MQDNVKMSDAKAPRTKTKRGRGPQMCNRCMQPRKKHECPFVSEHLQVQIDPEMLLLDCKLTFLIAAVTCSFVRYRKRQVVPSLPKLSKSLRSRRACRPSCVLERRRDRVYPRVEALYTDAASANYQKKDTHALGIESTISARP